MERNHLQPNNTFNAAFTPNTAPHASQQQQANPQGGTVPALGSAADLSNNPAAKNLQNYSAVAGEPDTFNLPEYQPIKPGAPYLEKLADEAMNTKKLNICLKNAQENEELGDFKDAEKAYKKALKYTDSAEHYKAYGECLKEIYRKLSQVPLTPEKDEAKERVYKEKAAKAFYYLGELCVKESAWQEAQAAYRASCDLVLHEAPLQALLEVSQKLGIKEDITGALVKLADFYAGKGDISTAIKKLEEAVQVEKSSTILEKLAALHGQVGGEDSQLKVNETRIHQFELQISQDPKNIGLYRKYVWFLKDIGKRNEARAVKERMDELLQQNFQALQQKVVKQKTKIGGLKEQVATLEKQVLSLDFSSQTDIQEADLIALLKKNPYIKFLNLRNYTNITDAGLAPLKGLKWLASLDLYDCNKLTDAGLQHLAGLSQLTSLNLGSCKQLSDAGLRHLAGLTQLTSLNLVYCSQLTDAGLQHLAGLSHLTSLNLQSCNKLTDAGLQHLAGLTRLSSLNLQSCNKLTDGGLRHLAGLTQLTSLNLCGCGCKQLTHAGLRHLAGLTQLKELNLYYCQQLTDAGLQQLAGLSHLTSLNLSYCKQLTDAGLQHLAGLSHLTSLNLGGCYLTDAGLRHLAGLSHLTELNLGGCYLTDAGLRHLAGLSHLTELNLYNCNKITDAGLQHLAGLSQLKELNLRCCKQLTSNAKEQLKKQIPGLRIR